MRSKLTGIDPNDAASLRILAGRLSRSGKNIHSLLQLLEADEPNLAISASWILKRWIEDGTGLTAGQSKRLLRRLNHVNRWETTLHLLQILPHIVVPGELQDTLHQSILQLLQHKNNFVRAWSYNALWLLGSQFKGYEAIVSEKLEYALEHEAPSVKARIRQIIKSESKKRK